MKNNDLIDLIFNNSVLSLIIGLILGIILTFLSTIFSIALSNRFNKKMWIKDKRLFYYSKSIDDLKLISKINDNLNNNFYNDKLGQQNLKEDLDGQRKIMEEYFTAFSIIAEDDVLKEYKKIYSSVSSNKKIDISNYEKLIIKKINRK